MMLAHLWDNILKKGWKLLHQSSYEKKVREYVRESPADSKVSEGGVEEVLYSFSWCHSDDDDDDETDCPFSYKDQPKICVCN